MCVQCFIMGITLMVCYETKNKTKLYCIYAFFKINHGVYIVYAVAFLKIKKKKNQIS